MRNKLLDKKVLSFLMFLAVASCTKAEVQYFVCGLAENVDPFTCLRIVEKE
ncbi:MAG: hypothetical protein VYE27_04245 [Pseudomonadota bacterium]|nr:hypothetical protein [Pseudomonadota bacterium]